MDEKKKLIPQVIDWKTKVEIFKRKKEALGSEYILPIQVSCPYPKVEHPYESFHKLKWHKAKKYLPVIYMENFLSIPDTKNHLLGLFWSLGYILVTNAENKLRESADIQT